MGRHWPPMATLVTSRMAISPVSDLNSVTFGRSMGSYMNFGDTMMMGAMANASSQRTSIACSSFLVVPEANGNVAWVRMFISVETRSFGQTTDFPSVWSCTVAE